MDQEHGLFKGLQKHAAIIRETSHCAARRKSVPEI